MEYVYEGACGAEISEDRHGDMTIFQCGNGRGMQCYGGGYAQELCQGCSMNKGRMKNERITGSVVEEDEG